MLSFCLHVCSVFSPRNSTLTTAATAAPQKKNTQSTQIHVKKATKTLVSLLVLRNQRYKATRDMCVETVSSSSYEESSRVLLLRAAAVAV
eukprot:1020-Heterococcus_DN1.PRE.2